MTREEEEDEVFLAIQDAYTMLSDPSKRRAYDSTNEFDDTIPKGNEAEKQGDKFDFFATYGPVFRSNSRWSNKPRVPDLGDDGTPLEHVHKFYEFWTRFDSWRDYSLDEPEHDVEQAECREEKRWMKENDKIAKKKKMDEYARIALLIDRARANDPRLARARAGGGARRRRELKDARAARGRAREGGGGGRGQGRRRGPPPRRSASARRRSGSPTSSSSRSRRRPRARRRRSCRDAHGEKARETRARLPRSRRRVGAPPAPSRARRRPLEAAQAQQRGAPRARARASRSSAPSSRRTRPRNTC